MAEEDERIVSPNGVFGPILLRSSTPPPSEKVSSFLRGMADAQRVSKPVSNYGSEFEHMASMPWDTAKGISLMGGRPVTIPADAQDMHELNDELFNNGDGSELSYGAALNNPNLNGGYVDEGDPHDEIGSNEQEHASIAQQTPRQVPQQVLSPGKPFRNGKVIDSSSSWGNKGPLPGGPPPLPMTPQQEERQRFAANNIGHTVNVPSSLGQTPIAPFINIQPPTSGVPSRTNSRMAPSDVGQARSAAGPPKSRASEAAGPARSAPAPPTDTASETEKAETVKGAPAKDVAIDVRPLSRAPSRSNSRPPSRSRAPSRVERPGGTQGTATPQRALSPTGRTDRSRANSQTPSKVPLPNSPTGGSYSYVPLHLGSPPKSPASRAPTNAGGSVAGGAQSGAGRPMSPLGNGSRKTASQNPLSLPRSAAPSKHSESITSPKSPTRLHPLTDILRDKLDTPSQKARSRSGKSVQSHRTGDTYDAPSITVQVTPNGALDRTDGRSGRSKMSAAPLGGGGSRAASRVSKRSALSREPSRRPYDDDDDEWGLGDQMKSLVMHDNPSREQVTEIDLTRTPRTSYTAMTTPSVLAGEVHASHFHDEELCILLHAADNPTTHDVVKKVLHKGVKDRVKRLGLDHQRELVIARKHHHQGVHRVRALKAATADASSPDEEKPPKWAEGLFEILQQQQQHITHLEQQQQLVHVPARSRTDGTEADEVEEGTVRGADHDQSPTVDHAEDEDEYEDQLQTPQMTVPIDTPHGEDEELYDEEQDGRTETRSKMGTATQREYEDEMASEYNSHVGKPELYRLRIKEPSASNPNEATWHVTDTNHSQPAQLPEIPGSEYMEHAHAPPEEEELRHHEVQERNEPTSPPLPPLPLEAWSSQQAAQPPSWQRVYQRLLSWALVWSEGELHRALQSTMPGNHVDEVALTVWITQTYKRYVRAKHVEHPPGRVDRLYVPPNIADAINVAVFHGRHGDARTMLRDLWAPFGFEGMPRLLIVLARHRRDSNHYVVHRFALPEGSLTTYDTYPEKTLADGRPLGWWFAIQAAWPNAMYPQPDNLVQKIIRINRPMQLNVDNSVAAAAIWRNLIMGSKAERSVDLIRLRDLISTEVKSIISRKELGRLSVMGGKSQWEEMQP